MTLETVIGHFKETVLMTATPLEPYLYKMEKMVVVLHLGTYLASFCVPRKG